MSCPHPPCTCAVSGEEFCSAECRDMTADLATAPGHHQVTSVASDCGCGHAECVAEAPG